MKYTHKPIVVEFPMFRRLTREINHYVNRGKFKSKQIERDEIWSIVFDHHQGIGYYLERGVVPAMQLKDSTKGYTYTNIIIVPYSPFSRIQVPIYNPQGNPPLYVLDEYSPWMLNKYIQSFPEFTQLAREYLDKPTIKRDD